MRQRSCTSGQSRLWKAWRRERSVVPPSRRTLPNIRPIRPQICSGVELVVVNSGMTMARESSQWLMRLIAKACKKCRAP